MLLTTIPATTAVRTAPSAYHPALSLWDCGPGIIRVRRFLGAVGVGVVIGIVGGVISVGAGGVGGGVGVGRQMSTVHCCARPSPMWTAAAKATASSTRNAQPLLMLRSQPEHIPDV